MLSAHASSPLTGGGGGSGGPLNRGVAEVAQHNHDAATTAGDSGAAAAAAAPELCGPPSGRAAPTVAAAYLHWYLDYDLEKLSQVLRARSLSLPLTPYTHSLPTLYPLLWTTVLSSLLPHQPSSLFSSSSSVVRPLFVPHSPYSLPLPVSVRPVHQLPALQSADLPLLQEAGLRLLAHKALVASPPQAAGGAGCVCCDRTTPFLNPLHSFALRRSSPFVCWGVDRMVSNNLLPCPRAPQEAARAAFPGFVPLAAHGWKGPSRRRPSRGLVRPPITHQRTHSPTYRAYHQHHAAQPLLPSIAVACTVDRDSFLYCLQTAAAAGTNPRSSASSSLPPVAAGMPPVAAMPPLLRRCTS